MAEAVWKNCKFYLGQYDFSAHMNALAIDYKVDAPDKTAMGDTAKTSLPGLRDVSIAHNGWWEAASPDSTLFTRIGASVLPITMAQTGATGETCFMFQPLFNGYTPGAKHGDTFAFSVKAEGSGPLVQGTIMVPLTTATSSSDSSIYQVGAVSSTQTLYAVLHAFAATTDGTITVLVYSDESEDFLSPTQRVAFASVTGATSEWSTLAGPITDDWWRVTYNLVGTCSITFVVAIGIL